MVFGGKIQKSLVQVILGQFLVKDGWLCWPIGLLCVVMGMMSNVGHDMGWLETFSWPMWRI
jgi:hypothetical protein